MTNLVVGSHAGRGRREPQWEYLTVTISRTATKSEYRQRLQAAADTGQWELRRVLVLPNGTRKVTFRRRKMTVVATV